MTIIPTLKPPKILYFIKGFWKTSYQFNRLHKKIIWMTFSVTQMKMKRKTKSTAISFLPHWAKWISKTGKKHKAIRRNNIEKKVPYNLLITRLFQFLTMALIRLTWTYLKWQFISKKMTHQLIPLSIIKWTFKIIRKM